MNNIAKILLVFCFLVIDNSVFSQPYRNDYIELYDYTTIINDLIKNGNKSEYYENLDYEAMLFLDKTSFKVLIIVNPHFLVERNIDTANIFHEVPEKFSYELPVDFTNINQLFFTSDIWKNVLLQLKRENLKNQSDMMIDKKIYIKDNQKAIFTVRVNSWSITYRVILRNKKLRFEELYEIQE